MIVWHKTQPYSEDQVLMCRDRGDNIVLFIVMVRREEKERKKELLLTIDAMLMIMIMNHDDAKESIAQTERKAACENNIFAAAAKYEGVTPFIIRYSFDFSLKIFLIICKYHLKNY